MYDGGGKPGSNYPDLLPVELITTKYIYMPIPVLLIYR